MSERIDGIENAGGSNDMMPNGDVQGHAGFAAAQDVTSREATGNDNGGTVDASGIVVPERHAAMRAVSIDDKSNANGNPMHDGTKPMGGTPDATQQDATPSTNPRRRARTRQASGNGSDRAGRMAGRTATSRKRGVTQDKQHASSAASDEVDFSDSVPNPYIGKVTPDGMHGDAVIAVRSGLADGTLGDVSGETSDEMVHDGMRQSAEHADASGKRAASSARSDAIRNVPAKMDGNDLKEAGHVQQHHAVLLVTRDDGVREAGTADGTPTATATSLDGTRHSRTAVSVPSDGGTSGDNGKPNDGDTAQRTHIASVPPFMPMAGAGVTVPESEAGTTTRRHHRHIDVTGHPDDEGAGDTQGVQGTGDTDSVSYGTQADDERTTVMDDSDEPTRLISRPAGGVSRAYDATMDMPDRTHDEVATAYGMSGTIPPIPPVLPVDGKARRDGRGNGSPRKDTRKRNVIIVAVIAVVLVVLGVAYGVGVSRYQSRLFPNTEIGGIDVSEMTADEAERATDTSDWHITIDDVTGNTVTIGQDEAGMSVSGTSPSEMIAAQDAFAWPLHVLGGSGQSADRTVSFDYDKLEQTLSSLDMCDAGKRTAATDASFRYDQSTGKWYVTPDAQGTVVDKDKLVSAVEGALDGLNSPTVRVTQDMCVQPSVTASDESLNAAVDDANKWISTSITYDIDDQQGAVSVDSSTILPWVSISRGDDGKFAARLDESAVKAYLAKIGSKYDTQGEQLTITTPTGKVASVAGTENDTGWLTDEAAELPKLIDDIKNGRTDHREFSMKHRANVKTGSDVWGTTYIEVDLSTQHLWYVKDGQVAEDFGIISGKSGYDTPQGVTAVYKKVTNVTLVSPWKDPKTGEPTYKTPIDVGLVISRDGNVLIHSAPWQPSSMFGNASYHVSGGSHGCVNAPTDKTWNLYNAVPLNTPVVVHA